MATHNILFQPANRKVVVQDKENLLRAAMEAGVHINASCGGEGVCGKCRVIIEKGDRMAQLIPTVCIVNGFEEVEELDVTDRNTDGIGSSGKK